MPPEAQDTAPATTSEPSSQVVAPVKAPEPAKSDAKEPAAESHADKVARQEQELNDDLRKAYRNSQKERTETGQFAPKDRKDQKPAPQLADGKEPVKATAPTKPDAASEDAKAPPPKAAVQAPNSWSAEHKAHWAKVPPEVQAYIAQRETESHKAISELGKYAKAMESMDRVIEPHAETIKRSGVSVPEYVNHLLAADQWLRRDPVNAMKELARQYNVDLNALAPDPFAGDPQSSAMSAQLQAAWAEIDHLKQMLGDTRSRIEGREASEAQARQSQLTSLVDEFAKDKADWSDLLADIESQVIALRRKHPDLTAKEVLEKAYEHARWGNPTTRERLIAAQQAEAETKRLEAAKQAAATAKRAGGINVNGAVPQKGQVSFEDDMRSIWRRHHAN